MKSYEALRALMVLQGLKPTQLARRLNVSKQVMNSRLTKIKTISSFLETVKMMDYKVVLVPSATRVKEDWFVVEDE